MFPLPQPLWLHKIGYGRAWLSRSFFGLLPVSCRIEGCFFSQSTLVFQFHSTPPWQPVLGFPSFCVWSILSNCPMFRLEYHTCWLLLQQFVCWLSERTNLFYANRKTYIDLKEMWHEAQKLERDFDGKCVQRLLFVLQNSWIFISK